MSTFIDLASPYPRDAGKSGCKVESLYEKSLIVRLNGVTPVQLAPISQTIATPGAKLFESHARTMCYSALFGTQHFSLHSSTNVKLEALIMITALKTEDSCQQVNGRSAIWNNSISSVISHDCDWSLAKNEHTDSRVP